MTGRGKPAAKRVWINVSLPDEADKRRYEKAARARRLTLAEWAREQMERGAEEVLGPHPFRETRKTALECQSGQHGH